MTRVLLFVPLAITAASAATCSCGYKDSAGAVWRESFVSDFTTGWSAALSQNFYKMTWNETHKNVPYTIQYIDSNAYSYNDGLGLKTSAFPAGSAGPVNTGGIASLRSDILYGSFRIKATVPTEPGVCFGFFTYKNDTQEADIEFLSSDANYYQILHHTNQPGLINDDTDPDAAKVVTIPGADFTAFHEHRLDWLPASSKYLYDGTLKSTVSKNSPKVASSLLANVWSDGGSGWTKGPPIKDSIATIYYIKAYFNSTSLSSTQFNSQCAAASDKTPCSI